VIADIAEPALQAVTALALSTARLLGCVSFIPGFGRSHMTAAHRNAICLVVGLPQSMLIWQQLGDNPPPFLYVALFGMKETLLGALVGLLLATPYWAFRSAFTLVDNQRGANAAQIANPSLQADSSVLGELSERALTVLLVQAGVFGLLFDAIANSYALWPVLSPMPEIFTQVGGSSAFSHALLSFAGTALLYSAPVLVMLLLIEFGFAISSTAAQGILVYETAMPVKSLAALFCMAIYFKALMDFALPEIANRWSTSISDLLIGAVP
jgi:type III secretion protein T